MMIPTKSNELVRKIVIAFLQKDPWVFEKQLRLTLFGYAKLFRIETAEPVDIGKLYGYTPQRWKNFVRSYLSDPSFAQWVVKCKTGSERAMHEYRIPISGGGHKTGACITSIGYCRIVNRLFLTSRSVQIVPMGLLDMHMIYLLGQLLNPNQPPVCDWFIQQLQLRYDFVVPYLIQDPELFEMATKPGASSKSKVEYVMKVGERVAGGREYKFARYTALGARVNRMVAGSYPSVIPTELYYENL